MELAPEELKRRKNLEKQKRWRDSKYEEGKCIHCGKRYMFGSHVICKVCYTKMNIYQKKTDPGREKVKQRMREIREYRNKNHLCIACGVELKDAKYKNCPKCRKKHREELQLYRIRKRLREKRA